MREEAPQAKVTRPDGRTVTLVQRRAHLSYCYGACCCGRTDRGYERVPVEIYKEEWYSWRIMVLLTKTVGRSKAAIPKPGWHLLRDGIRFTALAPDLYYSNDHKSFFSKIDFAAEIEELRPAEKPPWPFHYFVPKFYLKERFDMEERRECWTGPHF